VKILIIGAGGVGGYLAYKLKKCGNYVSAVDSKGKVKKLRVKDVDKEEEIKLDKLDKNYDVVFVTTKSYHLDNVIEKYKDFLKNSVVVPILNGIGHFEKFKEFNYKKACIYILSNKENGIIYKKTPLFYLCLEDDETLRKIFENCDLKVKFSKNIDKDIWKKYLFISTFATLQSFYQKPTGWIIEEKRDEVEKFLDEVIRIAKEKGIDLSDEKEKVIKQALNIPYNSKMSMQIDFENGNVTEVDNLTGFLAKKSEFINNYYQNLKRH
jgi:2-dehydropantoate 2-reductase